MSSDGNPSSSRRHRRLRSLTFRLNAWYVAVFVASLAMLVAFAIPTVRAAFARADVVVLENRIDRHIAVLSAGLPQYRTAIEHSAALGDLDTSVRIRDQHGTTLYEHGDMSSSYLIVERVIGSFRLAVGSPAAPWRAVVSELRGGAMLLILGAILLAVLGGYALTRRGLRPVRELAAATRDVIRSGDLSRRVPERGNGDELDEVSVLFNRMLARNQALVGGMREALDNVGHDLRTPLTRLRGTAEVALASDNLATTRDALVLCIEESDQVLTMLRTLMDISEAESGIMRLHRSPVSLDMLANDVVDLYDHVAQEGGIALFVRHHDRVIVDGDAIRLRQAIANLVDNALKYTPRGGTVTIDIAHSDAAATLCVTDTGIGIDPGVAPRIWDRLYRAEPSRSKPGLGLGLSLVKAIITAHRGTVSVQSEIGRGSAFTIALPIAASSAENAERSARA